MLWTLLGLYGGWLGLLFVLQRWLIFPTFAAGEPLPAPDGVEVVRIETAAGDCEALYWAPTAGGPAPAVVLFHGNAELVDHQAPIAGVLRAAGFAVLVPEYRGYGRCPGTPSQRAIVEDALRFVEQLAARPEVDAERIAYLGRRRRPTSPASPGSAWPHRSWSGTRSMGARSSPTSTSRCSSSTGTRTRWCPSAKGDA
jgi:hypothetical protein